MGVNLDGFGYNEHVTVSAASKTLTSLSDSGLVQDVTVSSTITLPATVVGNTFLVRVGKYGITLTIQPQAADYIAGNGLTNVDNKALLFTNQPAGSFVQLVADGVNGYMVQRISGTATKAP
jgi:predicted metal-dependent phosphotriesterase family hydrolase